MNTLVPISKISSRIRKMRKMEAKALYDAAIDVSKGSHVPGMSSVAWVIVKQIAERFPDVAS